MRNLERLAPVTDEQLRVFGDRALVDAEDAHLADEWVHHDLEHMRKHMFLRIGLGTELDGVLAGAFVKQRRIAFFGGASRLRVLEGHLLLLLNNDRRRGFAQRLDRARLRLLAADKQQKK